VNDSSEATHYQIELTSRQVLAALITLLVCLFAAFFAGVWIGRNAEADSAANELARVDEVARGGERFDFFSKTGAPEAGGGDTAGAAPAEAAPESSELAAGSLAPLGEGDFGPDSDDAELDATEGDQASMAGTDPDALFEGEEATSDGGLPPPEEMGRGGRRRRAAARAAEEDEVATTQSEPASATADSRSGSGAAPGPATAAAPTASSPPAAESGFHIQVLATSDRDKAEALVARLVDADFKAFIVPSNDGGRTTYRVRVGPFSDRAIAAGKAQELESRWGLDSWISPGAP
jgi:hypothetical protein